MGVGTVGMDLWSGDVRLTVYKKSLKNQSISDKCFIPYTNQINKHGHIDIRNIHCLGTPCCLDSAGNA